MVSRAWAHAALFGAACGPSVGAQDTSTGANAMSTGAGAQDGTNPMPGETSTTTTSETAGTSKPADDTTGRPEPFGDWGEPELVVEIADAVNLSWTEGWLFAGSSYELGGRLSRIDPDSRAVDELSMSGLFDPTFNQSTQTRVYFGGLYACNRRIDAATLEVQDLDWPGLYVPCMTGSSGAAYGEVVNESLHRVLWVPDTLLDASEPVVLHEATEPLIPLGVSSTHVLVGISEDLMALDVVTAELSLVAPSLGWLPDVRSFNSRVTDEHLYAPMIDTDELRILRLDDAVEVPFAPHVPSLLAVSEDRIAWRGADVFQIWAADAEGGAIEEVVQTTELPLDLVLADGAIFWLEADGRIYRLADPAA